MSESGFPSTLSVIIPAYNEAEAIGSHIRRILDYASGRDWALELLVVDDGSTDSTASIVGELESRHPEVRLLRQIPNAGKGAAVRRGLAEARGEILGFTDADASTDIAEIERVLPHLASGAEVVIGSRAKRQEGVRVRATLHRRVIGRSFNTLLRLILGLRTRDGSYIADTQCGFKWMTAAASRALLEHASVDGFAFDVELLYLANRLGLPIAEVPVNWEDRGTSSVDLLRDPPRMLASAVRVAHRHRQLGR